MITDKKSKLLMDSGRVALLPLLLIYRVKREYVPGKCSKSTIKNLRGAIIAANHTGFSDPFILNAGFWYRRFYYTASEEVMSGIKGKMLKAAGVIKVDRTTADLEAVKICSQVLKAGFLLGMFPQGHIGGEAVQGGVFLIAAMSNVPIVPAYIQKRKNFWHRERIIFGEPINIQDYCKKNLPDKAEIELLTGIYRQRMEDCKNGY